MSEQTGMENRVNQRAKLEIKIGMNTGSSIFAGLSMNISSGGLFVATYTPGAIGDHIPLSFSLPDSTKTIEVTGEVCWSRDYNPIYPDSHPGMGLRFLDLKPEDQKIINEFIAEGDFMLYERD